MQKLLLLLGIPLVFIAGIVAYETGQLLWLGIVVPLAVARYFLRRSVEPGGDLFMTPRDRPGYLDKNNVSSSTASDRDNRA
jgi:hypothetical protein